MTTTAATTEILLSYLSTGIRSAQDIRHRLNCSQPTVSRLLAIVSQKIITIGNARARRYARLRAIRDSGGDFPVYEIDTDGNAHLRGTLFAVALNEFLWKPVDSREQLFRSLPWFLADWYPDGFMGRAFVRRLHEALRLPPRGLDWKDDHVLVAMALWGEDAMGNLVVGREAIERYFHLAHNRLAPVRESDIPAAYLRLADEAMNGQPSGSSAGGEQPKFTTLVERDGRTGSVLVKFSPPITTDVGRRWADLLLCEDHALKIIEQVAAIPAAKSCIVAAGNRVFLEVLRFDRSGVFGRLPVVSLRSVDSELYGFQDNWIDAANRLTADRRMPNSDAASMRWLSVFGNLIGNNDQHFGNISLTMTLGNRQFCLAPAYDMLPMVYRPVDGAVPAQTFIPPSAAPKAPEAWDTALKCALLFWERAANEPRISDGFRSICSVNYMLLQQLPNGPRLIG